MKTLLKVIYESMNVLLSEWKRILGGVALHIKVAPFGFHTSEPVRFFNFT